ncbi:pyridoxal phosphate-dependent decarboxylase family protein [Marinicella sp. W31]|uniref:pyridoxal phosphate-dependent decarboxylase family protein n=1 Tax=Marinicella sp. W31 TaxID=3023713 RepID=UPI003756FD2A
MKKIQETMFKDMQDKSIFEQARAYAFEYADQVDTMRVYPTEESIQNLSALQENMPTESCDAEHVLNLLQKYAAPATVAQTAGRYFGFVNGGVIPAAVAAKWMTDMWDQCGGLYLTSPVNAVLESICEQWLKELFGLPEDTVAGFVTGTSMANLCALAAARYRLLKNVGWDVNAQGLNGAPQLKLIAHEHTHASIVKTLAMLGFGKENIHWVPSDEAGRIQVDAVPELDQQSVLILQAGNVNSGAFDPFTELCERAESAGAWVHVDGAFGLWAGASEELKYLTEGIHKATSWAVDGHKTLNTPYDCGIVLCRDHKAMITALQAHGDYLIYSDKRDPLLYTPEMSKRARAIELWATMKFLGRRGIDDMVTGFHALSKYIAQQLKKAGFRILNDVVFNQVLVACDDAEQTQKTLQYIQQSGTCWCGGSNWHGEPVIRISICSWATTADDVDQTVEAFIRARTQFKYDQTHE